MHYEDADELIQPDNRTHAQKWLDDEIDRRHGNEQGHEAAIYEIALDLRQELEDAQGEIRALRATEAGLMERVKELEDGLQSLASYPLEEFALESKPDNRQLFGANDWKLSVGNVKRARALLEKKE